MNQIIIKKDYWPLIIFCLLVIGHWSFGCTFRKPATAITADILTRGMVDMETEEDIYVAKETSLPLIKILEILHDGDPNNKKFLGLLAKTYGNYAFGFAELEAMRTLEHGNPGKSINEWPARAKKFYEKGMGYGIKALSHGKETIAEMTLPRFEKNLKKYGKKDVPTIFWTAFDWGSYINMSRSDITIVADIPRVEEMIDRVTELDPAFQCGVAYAFKGALIAGNPLKNGRDPSAAKPYFEKAMSYCDGKYLMNKVMYAEWYLSAAGDRKAMDATLKEVINSDASLLPSQRLANELAKERARLLLNVSD